MADLNDGMEEEGVNKGVIHSIPLPFFSSFKKNFFSPSVWIHLSLISAVWGEIFATLTRRCFPII